MSSDEKPYANLGQHIRNVREQSKRSLAEVSGAIEIDEPTLKRIETGQQRPEEDVMLLLISYFGIQDQEALHLWELADYDSELRDHLELNERVSSQKSADTSGLINKSVVMMLAMEVRTLYSDGLNIHANNNGLTLNFTQSTPSSSDQLIDVSVARVGMSYSQAEQVLKSLEQALLKARYLSTTKLLPPPAVYQKRNKK
jgi:transcriptional regulator with XRE-family HTH domain